MNTLFRSISNNNIIVIVIVTNFEYFFIVIVIMIIWLVLLAMTHYTPRLPRVASKGIRLQPE